MSEFLNKKNKKISLMKDLLIEMDKGNLSPAEIKQKFKEILSDVTPADIAIIENELITKEGFPAEKIHDLCEIHIEIFRESLEKNEIVAEESNPIRLLMGEHNEIGKILGKAQKIAKELSAKLNKENTIEKLNELKLIAILLRGLESHMQREENTIFPFLEKHDIIQPPKILWSEHDRLRESLKELQKLLSNSDNNLDNLQTKLITLVNFIIDLKTSHMYKENKILFPTAMQKITPGEWIEIKKSMNEIGYAEFTPKKLILQIEVGVEHTRQSKENDESGTIVFESGELSEIEIKSIIDTIPFEITFVDKKDLVKYFNKGDKRTFIRTQSIIGRSVQNCHPHKSIHIVEKIVNDFKSRKRDLAEFWINMNGKLVYIRYFAVRDKEGNYLGTLEVTQDATQIRNLKGEKRIYSEE
jgi:DUF438 domain-containing protein